MHPRLFLLTGGLLVATCGATCPYPTRLKAFTSVSGLVQLTFTEGQHVTLTCFPGYRFEQPMSGPEVNITCTSGQWLPATTCIPSACQSLPAIANAQVLNFLQDRTMTQQFNGDLRPLRSEVKVFCQGGWLTPDGRSQYLTTCLNTGLWSDTTPCSARVDTAYRVFRITTVIVNRPYIDGYSNIGSEQYQNITQSLQNALFGPMLAAFGSLYVGAQNFIYSADGNGQLRASFSALFQPTLQTPPPRVGALMGAAISDLNHTLTDPQTGNVFILQAEGTTVAEIIETQTPLFTPEEVLGLSIAGALVGLLALTLVLVCCCWSSPSSSSQGYCGQCCRTPPGNKGVLTPRPRLHLRPVRRERREDRPSRLPPLRLHTPWALRY